VIDPEGTAEHFLAKGFEHGVQSSSRGRSSTEGWPSR
jgi:hypothetical protein